MAPDSARFGGPRVPRVPSFGTRAVGPLEHGSSRSPDTRFDSPWSRSPDTLWVLTLSISDVPNASPNWDEVEDQPRVPTLRHVQRLLGASAGSARDEAICRMITGKQSR